MLRPNDGVAIEPTLGFTGGTPGAAGPPGPAGTSFVAGQDLSGSNVAQNVIGIQNQPVLAQVPLVNQELMFNGVSWTPGNLPGAGDSANALRMTTLEAAGVPAHLRPAYAPLVRLEGDARPHSAVCSVSSECGSRTSAVLVSAREAVRRRSAGGMSS
jgi:hypothetical protein